MHEPISRAQRWKAFYEEEGGLRDMLGDIRTAYLQRMAQVQPWETDKLSKLAMAHKITEQVDSFVQEIFLNGGVAEQKKKHIEKIEKLPERKRRWAIGA